LAPCPPDANGDWSWWCGQNYTNVCGTPDKNTSIFDYPANAYILKVAGTNNGTSTVVPNTATGTAAAAPLGQTTACSSVGGHSSQVPKITPIAVGIGIGVPLAMLAITLGFYYWKERKRRIIAERLGYAGQAFMVKQSFDKERNEVKPVYELAQEPPRAQLPG
jgi:hypothetical protein